MIMNKYYIKSHNRICTELCLFKNDGTMIGSINCTSHCNHCKEIKYTNDEPNTAWIKCDKLKKAVSTKSLAVNWWHELSPIERTKIADKHTDLIFNYKIRALHTLTSKEIETIYVAHLPTINEERIFTYIEVVELCNLAMVNGSVHGNKMNQREADSWVAAFVDDDIERAKEILKQS